MTGGASRLEQQLRFTVEIDAGDASCYDAAANLGKEERERQAARRVFGSLPADQAEELRGLREEFEAGAAGHLPETAAPEVATAPGA
ncbi:MAG TPA: HD domain-containing protein [Longimicrobiaceae bacterium]|nr:HD domain-containing protein [Longimicrobiaceae bacterium]